MIVIFFIFLFFSYFCFVLRYGMKMVFTFQRRAKGVRYEAFLFNDVLYRRQGHLYIWLTDDQRKLPVRVQVRLHFAIGTITFELEKDEKP